MTAKMSHRNIEQKRGKSKPAGRLLRGNNEFRKKGKISRQPTKETKIGRE